MFTPNQFFQKSVLAILVLFISASVSAETYTVNDFTKWTSEASWSPEYPGTSINQNDTVIINNHMVLNAEVVVNGYLIIKREGTVLGNKTLVISQTGTLVNQGNTVARNIINNGYVSNELILETIGTFDNSGVVNNNEHIVAGNGIYNTSGALEGDKGNYFTTTMMNSNGTVSNEVEVYEGGADLASNKPMVQGMSVMASNTKNGVNLNVIGSSDEEINYFRIERSEDGITYTLVDIVNSNNESSVALDYNDNNYFENKVHYKIQTVLNNGEAQTLPLVTVSKPSYETEMSAMRTTF